MYEWNFTVVQNPIQLIDFFDIPMPRGWGQWRASFFDRIPFTLVEISQSVQLIESGCRIGGSATLNCSSTCASPEHIFASPGNLWNCVTLATVAMEVTAFNMSLPLNGQEMNSIFHFGTFEDLNKLRILDVFYGCMRGSCSSFEYGRCSPTFDSWKPGHINSTNIDMFGYMLESHYCDDFGAQMDADIAGQGVLISSMIQCFLVLFFVLLSLIRLYFFGYHFNEAPDEASQIPPISKPWDSMARRLFCAVHSTLADLQEAQTIFTGVISIATIATYRSYMDLSQNIPVSSYVANMLASRIIVAAGLFSSVALQILLQFLGQNSGYSLFFIFVDWLLSLVMRTHQKIDASSYWESLSDKSRVPACGNNPGPMSYCRSPLEEYIFDLSLFSTGSYAFYIADAAYVAVPLLIIEWASWIYVPHLETWLERSMIKGWLKYRFPLSEYRVFLRIVICSALPVLMLSCISFSLTILYSLYSAMYRSGHEAWSFGQLVAVAVWLPILSKFFSLWIFGVKKGTEARIGEHYEVQERATGRSDW